MRQFYAAFVGPGDLVFDIGAHAGNRTRSFAALGCLVVAVEPQPDFARLLRAIATRSPRIQIVEASVGASPGRATLLISDRTPTVTTVAEAWRETRAHDPDFAGVRWNRRIEVDSTTLDVLIARFGIPAFVKIDVEGGEPAVLVGLTRAIPALSFEYLPRALDEVERSVARLSTLGSYLFNWSPGESYSLAASRWMDAEALLASLRTSAAQHQSGDVYARLTP